MAGQVGTTKDQPSAVVHPGKISRRDPTTIQYNTVRLKKVCLQKHLFYTDMK